MQLFYSFLQSTFYPSAMNFSDSEQAKNKAFFCKILGLIGFIVQGIFIFPADEINFNNKYNALLNNIVGAMVGIVLFELLIRFDLFVTKALKIENRAPGLYISYGAFGLMPLVTIPIHMIFFDQLTLRGHFWIVCLMIIALLAWHNYIFGAVINAKENGIANKIAILLVFEVLFAFLFLVFAPQLTGNSTQIFLEEYF